jgi:hypothetical protein
MASQPHNNLGAISLYNNTLNIQPMKSFSTLLIGLAFLTLFSGCEKFEDKKFSTTIEVRFPVQAQSDNNGSFVVDLSNLADVMATNVDLAKVKENIKRYELVGIKYKIFEYWDSPNTTFNGSIGFGNKYMTQPGTEFLLPSFNLQESMVQTELSKMEFSSADIAKIQQYFTDSNELKVFFKGTLSETPSNFNLYLQIDIDAIAEVEK